MGFPFLWADRLEIGSTWRSVATGLTPFGWAGKRRPSAFKLRLNFDRFFNEPVLDRRQLPQVRQELIKPRFERTNSLLQVHNLIHAAHPLCSVSCRSRLVTCQCGNRERLCIPHAGVSHLQFAVSAK